MRYSASEKLEIIRLVEQSRSPCLRNHAEIVLAHVNREPPKSAALPFPQGCHSRGRCLHGGLPTWRGQCTQSPKA